MHRTLLCAFISCVITQNIFCQIKKAPVKTVKPPASPFFNIPDDPKPVKYIQFKKDTPVYVPQHFYIQKIEDLTNNKDSIGFLLQPKSGKMQPIAFSNGAKNDIEEYFNFKIAKDSSLFPLVFVLKALSVSEEKNNDYRNGTFKYSYSYEYRNNSKPLTIGGGEGKFTYTNHISQPRKLDSTIAKALTFGLVDIDKNIAEAMDEHPAFCKGVNTSISVKTDADINGDTLFYNGQNDISWDDFTGNAAGADNYFSPHIGVLFIPDVNYKNGHFQLDIKTGTYFVRSASWVGKKAINAALLYHIQYRFKLAWLEALKLKKRIANTTFTCTGYEAELRTLYENASKELLRIFDEYATQTLTGSNKKEQYRWQILIDKEIESEN